MRRDALVTLAVTVAAAGVAAGCGGDSETKTVTNTVTQTETSGSGQTQPGGATTSGTTTAGKETVTKDDAELAARREASAQLEDQPGGFSVAKSEWQVSCSGGESGGAWTCKVDQGGQGPCSGTVTVTPQADGSTITNGKVGCIAD
jgi:hypothetical protein